MLVEGRPKPDFSQKMIAFDAYTLAYTGTMNTITGRCIPTIALRQSNNAGGHYFMSLYTGRCIHIYDWKELPIDKYVIERLESLADAENQPIVHQGYPILEWASGELINEKVDEEVPHENLMVDVYRNTDNDENEVQDIIV